MEKRPWVKKYLCCLIVPLFLFTFVPGVFSQSEETPEVGMVKAVTGKVWLHRDGKKEEARKTMELKTNDVLEIEELSSASIVYFKGGKKEQYTSKATLKIGTETSIIQEGSASLVQDLPDKKIKMDKQEGSKEIDVASIAHAGGQFLRGSLQPKQYFEDKHIQRYAVVVGISDYKDPKIPDLKYADADAQSFCDFITSPIGGNFLKENVLLLKNEQATLKNVKIALTNFLKKAIDTDFVVIYMACHGEPEPDRPSNLYLLMHDSELENLSATAYYMENVNADMKRYISAKRLIFFADACHVGGLSADGASTRGFSNSINVAISSLKTTREGWGVVSASRAGEVSTESSQWGGGHGAFTYYLLEGMRGGADVAGNKNGIVTLAEAFDYVDEKVKRATLNAQHPDTSGNFDNNLPLGFPGLDAAFREKDQEQTQQTPRLGMMNIESSPPGAIVYIGSKEAGVTPFCSKFTTGTYPVTIKKNGYADATDMVFVNPDEKTDVVYALRGTESRESAAMEPSAPVKPVQEHAADTVAAKEDKQKTKDNVDALIKELESMAKGQDEGGKAKTAKKVKKGKPEQGGKTAIIPISIKAFTVKMGLLSNRREMERLRQRIIDALLTQKGLSIVERDLAFQEEILREQRLSGSVLADELYRVELGKIQGASFLCFGGVSPGDTPEELVLRMEIVDTATTLIDTIEHAFAAGDNVKNVAGDIAVKIRDRIAVKRKL